MTRKPDRVCIGVACPAKTVSTAILAISWILLSSEMLAETTEVFVDVEAVVVVVLVVALEVAVLVILAWSKDADQNSFSTSF